MGRKKNEPPPTKKTPLEIRAEAKEALREEKTLLRQWKTLEEAIHSEDVRREQFVVKKLRDDTTVLPLNVQKLIGSLKKAVHLKMRTVGGSVFSILRNMFLYWDKDKSGRISPDELKAILNSLGVRGISDGILDEIIAYYANGHDEMSYMDLLGDIQKGEAPIIADVTEELSKDIHIRFQEVGDTYMEMPERVRRFVEAVRNFITAKLRTEKGTPAQLLLVIFQKSDFDHSTGLSPNELCYAAKKHMKLAMSSADANQVIGYYDRKNTGELNYVDFVKDVCAGITSFLDFREYTEQEIAAEKKRVAENPFIPVPFKAPPNKVLERIKRRVRDSLEIKMRNTGGSTKSWVKEAFIFYDPRNLGVLTNPEDVRNAMKSIGVEMSVQDATTFMTCYDVDGTGLRYNHFIDDVTADEPHFMAHAVDSIKQSSTITPTARAPQHVQKPITKFMKVLDGFVRKSKGSLLARDVLHGTFLRFDEGRQGRVDAHATLSVARELGVPIRDEEVQYLITWFDTNGSGQLDYNEFTMQLCGDDGLTKTFSLPSLSQAAATVIGTGPGSSKSSMFKTALYKKPTSQAASAAASKPFENLGTSQELEQKKVLYYETKAIRDARKLIGRSSLLRERTMIQSKLEAVDRTRTQLIEDHRARAAAKLDGTI